MCHKPTAMSDTPEGGAILPFLRTSARPGAMPPRPSRLSLAGAIDSLSETRAMVGLVSLASEALPGGHGREFGAVLETIYDKLDGILEALQRGAGQPPLEPVEA